MTYINYASILDELLAAGDRGPDETLELRGLSLQVRPDDTAERPGFSRSLADEMARQLLAGEADYERFKAVAPNHDETLWESHDFEGRFTWPELWPRLRSLASGRQGVHLFAVVGTYAPPACWTTLQAFERSGRISLVLYQRSCDIWRGFPYDLAMLKAVWTHLADGREMGECHWFIGSLHLYPRDVEAAENWLA